MANVSSHAPPRAAAPGRIGAYRITGELGRGGIGTVYRAVDPAGRAVALKCLLRGGDPDTDARLLRESSLRIEHQNVVRTLGGGLAADGQPYLVLELLEGQTLREALVDAPVASVVGWLGQAARGVAALHAAGLVHRDLKPENLFLTREGVVKVLDLGIATWTDERARLTATGAVIGTPAYLSPEQVRGGRALDPRTDVWALGVVLFEGLTGRSPFRREGALATMLAVSVDPIPRVDDLAPHVHPRLARLVQQCLERAIDLRLPSAESLAKGLEDALATATSLPIAPAAPRADRERSIALFVTLANADTRDAIDAIVKGVGGESLWLPDGRVVGVFGAAESIGDEADRTLRAADGVVKLTGCVSVALGRASVRGAEARGEAVREAG
ncbi:MAG: serine/threonine protein kinase, partial [Sandaracinaceae bacterium]|nr:serine/threonine protein kinase [Sandaracinaceae bacterium]